ncbi:DUF5708 family protein [Streptomyces phaeochromogenes]|uniref:DUF5708 family protein n=1 Tax=Streptomyces phaeochromogenes TaxID=1923 RepID=A0ABZ1HBW0_STRPH|nr:DUF5708 family protein [Streptomyces phaeochromogenes]WRZ30478.1 DUF5708 family protein [Streptomyces phaeochromogenes]WSD16078.1 DUF5708 family protein [Streptomyces phaeochromogenes]
MSPASKNLAEGSATLLAGLALKLFADGVEISFVSLPKAGVVMMVIGGVQTLFGLFQATRTSSARG